MAKLLLEVEGPLKAGTLDYIKNLKWVFHVEYISYSSPSVDP